MLRASVLNRYVETMCAFRLHPVAIFIKIFYFKLNTIWLNPLHLLSILAFGIDTLVALLPNPLVKNKFKDSPN